MQANNRHIRALELDKILGMLAELASCPASKERALAIQPAASFREAMDLMRKTGDAHQLTNRFGTPSIYGLVPCGDAVGRARVGGMLSMRELLDIAGLLRCARTLNKWKSQAGSAPTSLDSLFFRLEDNRALEEEIARCILSEEEMADSASPELGDIRRKIRQSEQHAREQLDRMIRSTTYQKYLQDQIITIRNGRFVVPVKAEHRGEIKGLIHDTSSSGATLFVEPLGVVEANNQIRELESREAHEVSRILFTLSDQVGDDADRILTNYDVMIQLDVQFAKSRLADKMKASVPDLVEQGETHLKKARHPLIDSGKIVPIDIRLGGEFDTLVITGPNTGGKTVALKTLGLFVLMSQCGLMIPAADGSTVCVYRQVLADIGDEQSIEQNLSTFSAHMTNIISILGQTNADTLVLIDELGAGTDPIEGAALGVSIIAHLRRLGAKLAATTHYAEIKMYALQTQGVENGSCEFDVNTLSPTYRLLIGVPGRSNAFAISQRLGLPLEIIEEARQQMSKENTRFEDVVSGLEQTRQELEREKEQAAYFRRQADALQAEAQEARKKIDAQAEEELARAREKARGLVEQVKFQSDQLLNELEDLKKQKDKDDFSATVGDVKSTLRSYLRDLEDAADPIAQKKAASYKLPRALKRGDTVFITDIAAEGTVLSPPDEKGYVQVQAGIIKTKAELSSLRLVEKKKVTYQSGSTNLRSVVGVSREPTHSEVDLRGMDSLEALIELDRYIDSAILSNIKTITIIHGKGTGALRAAVHQRLRKHKSVRTFRLGVYGEGEAGVTVAELK